MATAINIEEDISANWELVKRLNKDLRDSAYLLDKSEARYLVDLYYTVQEQRQRAASQTRGNTEPHELTTWLFNQFKALENDVKKALVVYASSSVPARWAQSIHGIGPVIAAGLAAHIDVNPWRCKAPIKGITCKSTKHPDPHKNEVCGHYPVHTAGGVWRFAGLDPTLVWEKGEKRPWNARLKRLAWIIGDSFKKQRNSPKDFYGKFYDYRKQSEIAKNMAGDFAPLAAKSLESRTIKDKDLKATYEAGRLPDGRIDLRAMRYAEKIFLSHYHHVAYEDHFGTPPPKPYVIEHLGHTKYVGPPNWPL